LQKTVYLLEAKGVGFGVEFEYHKHGPYSTDLALAAEDAEARCLLRMTSQRGFHEIPYTVFHSTPKTPPLSDDVDNAARKRALATMNRYSALALELAATAVFLREHGYREGYWEEVKKRKSLKASAERLEQAKRLLGELELEPVLTT
jgi:uncharacterized protein YwgA